MHCARHYLPRPHYCCSRRGPQSCQGHPGEGSEWGVCCVGRGRRRRFLRYIPLSPAPRFQQSLQTRELKQIRSNFGQRFLQALEKKLLWQPRWSGGCNGITNRRRFTTDAAEMCRWNHFEVAMNSVCVACFVCVGGLVLRMPVCAFGGFLLLLLTTSACPTITCVCRTTDVMEEPFTTATF